MKKTSVHYRMVPSDYSLLLIHPVRDSVFVMAPLRGAKRRKKAAAEKKAAMAAAAAGQGAPGGDWWDGFCMRMAAW
ncbi:hypothetical protein TRIUR3_18866 [Triticum urartu]|uniref:Uncharacterized protein n=1 Tax=Triticum urartu TaxID=4572 RepID=M7ZL48_TRIUA|nr:hypothetical protein TRIUR3_18866 [Triticum urartu]